MIINWVAAKTQQLLPAKDARLDELNVSFDFALSPEVMNLLFAQNDDCMDAGAVAETRQLAEIAGATTISGLELDEHELALA
ncbi:hypothetical protein [Methylobacter svalbardensis]|uniref:hypothetical protein n=1 Tax=Methylobacter svalbardensis TaxID=3080016 RepID=UPI0030EEF69C